MNINATLIGQAISFFLFVMFCMKFVWPPNIQALNERKKQIADGIAAAERGQNEQVLAENKAKEKLHEAKQQAGDIINLAQKRASEIVDEAKNDAREEGGRLIAAAKAELDQEVNRAREQLRTQVGSIAVAGAAKILEREIDEQAHSGMLDDLVSQL